MYAHLQILWSAIRDSLWFVPALTTLGAAAIAVALVELERSRIFVLGDADHWLFGGGPEGALQMLSTIATGLITVTGVVFSVTTVSLQLASSQFTPRVLRNWMADRSNQWVLGVFIGTFTYSLLVLRVVRSASPDEEPFVPRAALLGAVVLVLVSIGFLIYYINHAARAMQVSYILEQVTRRSIRHVERLFPEDVGQADDRGPADSGGEDAFQIRPLRGGYLQAVDEEKLFDLGRRRGLLIRMERRVGEFVLPTQALASVSPADAADDAVEKTVRTAFVLGPERTPEQDLEYGILEIADIAVKALSPGINDPTTATHCIDRLGEVLCLLASRRPPCEMRTKEGVLHFRALRPEFEHTVELAFGQIRHFGGDNPAIASKLISTLDLLADAAPEARKAPLRSMAAELRGLSVAPDQTHQCVSH
ncbi:MAG TPA: DUF2254 domain-containing protein [Pirellulaceae bacterium]|jgi:uncharacterized membrane protein|nr:DUF2254 domain-containing protein [Pirellulaceae bacterium]